ncbi:hypothetical protein [Aliikangiella sp. IMCC44632]
MVELFGLKGFASLRLHATDFFPASKKSAKRRWRWHWAPRLGFMVAVEWSFAFLITGGVSAGLWGGTYDALAWSVLWVFLWGKFESCGFRFWLWWIVEVKGAFASLRLHATDFFPASKKSAKRR